MHSPFRRRSTGPTIAEAMRPAPDASVVRLLAATRFELVPLKSVEAAMAELPPGTATSVTCSPAKGLSATLDVTARLLDAGHDAVPHLSARLVEGPHHVAQLAAWIRAHRLREIFVIAGDVAVPAGPYADGAALLRHLFDYDTGLERVGVPAYPDGHPLIPDAALRAALHEKQALIAAAGLAGSATTQMCFDADQIRRWLLAERAVGFVLPVDLGVPGVVDRAKLMSMGVRLGIGSSLRFLRKQRSTMTAMLAPGGYDPTDLVTALATEATDLGIAGVHAFTFNSVARTAAWRRSIVDAT
ncbi:MAG: 5,10-methylenetetrahydrofolate reductase [Actinomycetota bacterium]|nr:5,10-methylenetetrahydrofolate reductase [Actinomycetota bacterium]